MRKLMTVLACVAAMVPAAALAGPYSDDLSKCLVGASTVRDKEIFATWMFAAISVHPIAERYARMTDAERTEMSRQAGLVTQRLLTQECRKEAVLALKYERTSAFEKAFGTFGEVAMIEIMSNAKVNKVMEDVSLGLDEKELEKLGAEAGLQP